MAKFIYTGNDYRNVDTISKVEMNHTGTQAVVWFEDGKSWVPKKNTGETFDSLLDVMLMLQSLPKLEV